MESERKGQMTIFRLAIMFLAITALTSFLWLPAILDGNINWKDGKTWAAAALFAIFGAMVMVVNA
jgi:hypothetical protein